MRSSFIKLLSLFLLTVSAPAVLAEWTVETYKNNDRGLAIKVAVNENDEGYKLEIYRDENGVVRSRFSTENTSYRMNSQFCPTFDIEQRGMQNVSINGESCLADSKWAEFILGYIIDEEVTSTPLYNFMNGRKIIYRFILQPHGYAETSFSLINSKRILLEALGYNLTVRTDKGYTN